MSDQPDPVREFLEAHPLFEEETTPADPETVEIVLGPWITPRRRDLPPKVQALVDKGWPEAAAREAVAVEEGDLGGDSGFG